MQPLELTQTGFKGIAAGMGLETFHIDLREFADAKLVAIVGPNGRGKTTMLDNLQPYRLMPSKIKDGNYSPTAFSFFDHLVSPGKAAKELIWEHKGTQYKTIFEWKMTEKTQGGSYYLQQQTASGEFVPVTLPDGTSSDGKAGTYDKCIEGVLGSPRLYFTAAFSAQGRSQLSSYGQGDIKSLMAEVLGLDKIQALGVKGGEVVKGLRSKLTDKRDSLVLLKTSMQKADELKRAISAHAMQLKMQHLPAIDAFGLQVAQEQQAIILMQQAQQDVEKLLIERKAVQQRISEANTAHSNICVDIEADSQTASTQHKATLKRLDADAERISGELTKAHQRKFSADQALAERDAITLATEQLPVLRESLAAADTALADAQAKANAARQANTDLLQLDRQIKTIIENGQLIRASETGLLTQCALTKEVPCQGTDLQGRCKLLADALTAESQLPAVQESLKTAMADYEGAKTNRGALAAHAAMLPALEVAVTSATTARKTAATAVTTAEAMAAKALGLATAETALEDAKEAIRAGGEQSTEVVKQKTAAVLDYETRQTELGQRLATATAAIEATRQSLQTELDRIPVPDNGEALVAAQKRLTDATKAHQDEQAAADQARGAIATAEGSLTVLQASIDAGASLTAEVAHLEAEIIHWTALQKALGRDGILALSIDDAGPTLAALTNDLLANCYGPRFSVRIDTQETVKSTGAQKETFDIMVYDNNNDTWKSVSEMSGGEKIWINEAITRALALFQAQQSGQTFHTLFSDESDGALDADKKGQFVRMKRRVLELGGYGREYFISHSPDVWPLADAVIKL